MSTPDFKPSTEFVPAPPVANSPVIRGISAIQRSPFAATRGSPSHTRYRPPAPNRIATRHRSHDWPPSRRTDRPAVAPPKSGSSSRFMRFTTIHPAQLVSGFRTSNRSQSRRSDATRIDGLDWGRSRFGKFDLENPLADCPSDES